MKPETSLPNSQLPATCLYPEPAKSNPCPHIPLPEDPCIILSSTPGSPQWSLSLRFPHKNSIYASQTNWLRKDKGFLFRNDFCLRQISVRTDEIKRQQILKGFLSILYITFI
jgi:hypothetical protein